MSLSVAIATYNRAAMVRQAVEAALGQSRAPDEIVIADDASTDDTGQVLDRLSACDARVRVIRQPVNSGGVANWNRAMAATRGDLIAWCSDDDRFLPGHLEASSAYLEAHPEIGMVHSSFIDTWETPRGTGEEARLLRSARPIVIDRRNLWGYLIRYYDWPFHPSTLVMRRCGLGANRTLRYGVRAGRHGLVCARCRTVSHRTAAALWGPEPASSGQLEQSRGQCTNASGNL